MPDFIVCSQLSSDLLTYLGEHRMEESPLPSALKIGASYSGVILFSLNQLIRIVKLIQFALKSINYPH